MSIFCCHGNGCSGLNICASFTVLCTSKTWLWARMCNYYIPVAMATMGLECVIIACSHGNRANPVVSCAKFDAHTHCHCQVIRVQCI